jgi:glycosyltransferase involved in cell wall biosynthesis
VRVTHVITKLDVGGAQSMLRELAIAQVQSGFEVQVLTGFVGPGAMQLEEKGVSVVQIPYLVHQIDFRADRQASQELQNLCLAWQPDLVHCHSSKAGLLTRRVCERLRIPCVFTAHGLPFRNGAKQYVRAASFWGELSSGFRTSAHVVCVSESDLRTLSRLRIVKPDRLHLVLNGTGALAGAPSERPARPDGVRVVCVGRFEFQKRQELIIEAVQRLGLPFSLVLVGDGVTRWPLEVATQHRNPSNVTFLGETDPTNALQQADVFALASRWEGMPMTILEAMREGLPIVASDIDGMADLVTPEIGLLSANTVEGFVTAFSSLRQPDLRSRLGQASFERWRTRHSVEAMTAGYGDVYQAILS